MSNDTRAALAQALEALRLLVRDYHIVYDVGDLEMQPALWQADRAIEAAEAALAEPDIWQQHAARDKAEFWARMDAAAPKAAPAPVAQPTDEQIDALWREACSVEGHTTAALVRQFARAVLALRGAA
jgi:hypothetical protein